MCTHGNASDRHHQQVPRFLTRGLRDLAAAFLWNMTSVHTAEEQSYPWGVRHTGEQGSGGMGTRCEADSGL
jgi:hypothetical protein